LVSDQTMPPRDKVMASKPELTDDNDDTQYGIGQMTRRLITTGKDVIMTDNTRKLFYNLLTALLTLCLILSVSVFTYGSFYFAYMPTQVGRGEEVLVTKFCSPRFMRTMLISSSLLVCPAQDFVVSQMPR
jgi:hypothetical protein